MPDVFPQALNVTSQLSDDTPVIQRIDFPLVVGDTGKRIINEITDIEYDFGSMASFDSAQASAIFHNQVALVTLSQPESSEIVPTAASGSGTGLTIGDTNVVDAYRASGYLESDGTNVIGLFHSPVFKTINKGGLGMLIPQDHVWLGLYFSFSEAESNVHKVGIRIWYRQRTVKAEEFLGLLASRTQQIAE